MFDANRHQETPSPIEKSLIEERHAGETQIIESDLSEMREKGIISDPPIKVNPFFWRINLCSGMDESGISGLMSDYGLTPLRMESTLGRATLVSLDVGERMYVIEFIQPYNPNGKGNGRGK